MADSDEEYDRRKTSREKFRRERNDYERRDDRRREGGWDHERTYSGGGRNREAWNNRNRERNNSYREYDNRRRDRYNNSPPRHDLSPPQKRIRRDWDDNYPQYDMPYGGSHMHGGQPPHANWAPVADSGGGPPQQYGSNQGQRGPEPDYPTQPSMVTFKQFLSQQDDSIGDEDAVKKYNEYKLDFKRQQINEFFLAHKDEEWFKTKYHPEDRQKRQEEMTNAQKRRLEVFLELLNTGRLNNLSLDADKYDDIVKILDAAVILLEGGTEFDLQVLDEPEPEEQEPIRSRNNSECVPPSDEGLVSSPEDKEKKIIKELKPSSPEEAKPPDQPLQLTITAEQEELKRKAEEFSKQQLEKTSDDEDSTKGKKKRHRDKEYSYESGSESDSGSDSEPEPAPPGLENEPPPPGIDAAESENTVNDKDGPENKEGKSDGEEKDVDTKEVEEVDLGPPKPKALHRTTSIFLRNLAPSITKQEVEAMCKRYPGFLRAALQDPQPERRFFRRGWVTFDRTVNIKEICWNLNNIRLRDCELGATINRELAKRVRPVGTFTHHKQVVKNDIKLAARIVQNYDKKWKLWEDQNDEKKDTEKEPSFCIFSVSKNPLLKNITDYLVDEGNFEEEELLGQSVDDGTKEGSDVSIERDETLLKVLDRLVLYLRIVHSIDYYSANEYPNEDEMPHRCGIIHARGSPLGTGKTNNNDINDWISLFENKVKHFTELQDHLNEEEAVRLGKKDPEAEVEKFVTANTQELAQDRWLCPLSGKKFKGPEFVRKHIFSKHNEKVDEVKKEVYFFNNYLLDPKRPQLPEHPGNRQQSSGQSGGSGYNNPNNFQGPQGMMGYSQSRGPGMYGNGPQGSYQSSPYGGRDNRDGGYGRNNYNRRPYHSRPYNRYRTQSNDDFRSRRGNFRRSDPRGIIEYRDLDAPADMDIF